MNLRSFRPEAGRARSTGARPSAAIGRLVCIDRASGKAGLRTTTFAGRLLSSIEREDDAITERMIDEGADAMICDDRISLAGVAMSKSRVVLSSYLYLRVLADREVEVVDIVTSADEIRG